MEQKKRQTKSVEAREVELEIARVKNELKSCLHQMLDLTDRYHKAVKRISVMETVKGMRQGLDGLSGISREFAELAEKAFELSGHKCAYCGDAAQGNFSIHRDGFCMGPQVDLCDNCGSTTSPSCEQIWEHIAIRKDRPFKTQKAVKADGRLSQRFSDATSKLNLLLQGLGR